MKIILKENVENLGESGDIVKVKPGFARNYLIPRGLGYVASPANLKKVEEERKRAVEDAKRDYLEAKRRAAQLENMILVTRVRSGEEGKLFGSITNAEIAERIQEQGIDFELDRRRVELEEPIKLIGAYQVPVRLHSEVTVHVEVRVESEDA